MTTVSEKPNLRDQQREIQKAETRAKVLAAAVDEFRRTGFADASIDAIARAAGVSRGTFYFHFPAKEDVLAELLRRAEEPVAAAVHALPPRATLAELLQTLAAAVMEQWQGEPDLFPMVGMEALRRTGTGQLDARTDPVRAAVGERFSSAQARHELTSALPAEQLADMFLVSAF